MYQRIVQELIDLAAMSENDIALAVESSQPTIHRIKKGHAKFDVGVGDRLRLLHLDRIESITAPHPEQQATEHAESLAMAAANGVEA